MGINEIVFTTGSVAFWLEFCSLKNVGRMDRRTDGRTDGWTDGRMDGWTDGVIEALVLVVGNITY